MGGKTRKEGNLSSGEKSLTLGKRAKPKTGADS